LATLHVALEMARKTHADPHVNLWSLLCNFNQNWIVFVRFVYIRSVLSLALSLSPCVNRRGHYYNCSMPNYLYSK